MDGVAEVVAGIDGGLERLLRPQDRVAEAPNLFGRDGTDQVAVGLVPGNQDGRAAS